MPQRTLVGHQPITGNANPTTSVPWALAGLSLSALLPALGTSISNVGLPAMAEAFDASFQQVQWIVLAYLLAITTLIVSVGRLGDIAGRRRLLLAGIVLFTVASVLSGLAPSLEMLIAARAAQGLGAAVMMALAMALVSEMVSKARIGNAMGLLGTMSATGTALGPSLGGLLIAGLGWRAIFLISVPLGMVSFVLAYRYLPLDRQTPRTDRATFDKLGTLLLALTLAAYALAMTIGRGSFGAANLVLLMAAGVGAGLFMRTQARVSAPLVPIAMLRDRGMGASLTANALVSTVMMATLVVGPFYLALGLGLNPALVGIVMSVGPVTSALSGVLAGRSVDRLGPPFAIIAGLTLMAVGTFALAFVPAMFGIAGYVSAVLVLTPGYQLFQAANNTAVMLDVSSDRRGLVSGVLNMSRNLGLITGASLMGAVFAFGSRAVDPSAAATQAVASGMRLTCLVAGILILLALAIVARSRSRATSPIVSDERRDALSRAPNEQGAPRTIPASQ